MQWFKHDSSAHADAKLRRVRLKYGLQGYGLYWYCLELIAQNIESHNLTFELEHDAELIAFDVGLSRELVEEMMLYMVHLGLFEAGDGGRIFCVKMLKRMDTSMVGSPKLRGMIAEAKDNHDAVMMNHDDVMQERKKERKIDKPKSQKFIPPTVEEIQSYCDEKGYTLDAEKFHAHHATRGWVLKGGQSMKCWKSAVTTWHKNEHQWNPRPSATEVEV